MKLIILKNNILEGISAVERSTGINANLPILKDIVIKTIQGKICFVATNLEIAITHKIQGKVLEEGEIAIPLQIFSSVAKNLNAERISLETKGTQLVITTDNYEATVQGHDAKDFPIIPPVHSNDFFSKLDVRLFFEAFQNVIVATQYSEIRPEISGVFMKYSRDRLIVAATDSFRLAERVIHANQATSSFDEASIIVPLRAAEELLKISSVAKGEIKIIIDANQVLFKTENTELVSRLVDGVFPEYQAIIPKVTENEVTLDRGECINALKLASAFSGKTNDITVKIGENGKFLELNSSDSALGENHYRIPIKFKGEPFSVVFNWKYLLDGLKIYSNKEIILGINTPDRPAAIKTSDEPDLKYVVMPIRN